jgi:multiple sugar transport system permease protein
MVLPAVLVAAMFFVYPIFNTIYLSFFKYSPMYGKEFIGFKNYIRILQDSEFYISLAHSFMYSAGVVGANFLIGMGFALLTYKEKKGVKILRSILITPMLFIPAAAAITWSLLYDEEIGVINHFLELILIGRKMWLASGSTALIAVIITDVWAWTAFVYLILLAGLQSIPLDTIESAIMDGATQLQRLWYIMLPMMKPVIAIAIILKTLDTFRSFVFVWIMTRGGPGTSSQILSTFIFRRTFIQFRYGMGSSIATLTLIFAFLIVFALMKAFREEFRG